MRSLLLVAAMLVLVGGCAARAPHSGLVGVHLSGAVADYLVAADDDRTSGHLPPVRLAQYADDGAHYWDAVGAQLRVSSTASVYVDVVPDDGGAGSPGGDAEGWWSPVDGKIHVVLPLRFSGPPDTYRTFFAHELGHAMGLDHVDDRNGYGINVMDPVDTCPGIGELDRAAFVALD